MLESKKPEYENYFITKWNGIAEEIIVAFNLTTFFLKEINYLAREKMKKWMYNDFLEQNKKYSTKFQLHMAVLTDLCQQENYREYISYIKNPIDYIEFWLLDKMKKIYSNKSNNEAAITIFKIELQSLITFCIESAKNANYSIIKEMRVNLSKVPTSSKKNIQDFWKAHFIDEVNKEIHFNANDVFNFFDANTICDYESFFKAFKESLGNFEIDCTPLIFCIELKDKIIRSYFQCTEYCLFCSELCIRHTGDKHSCGTFHRPHCLKPEIIRQYQLKNKLKNNDYNDCSINVLKKLDFSIKGELHDRNYKEFAPGWEILGKDAKNSIYWKWFIVNFHQDLFNQKINLPKRELKVWKSITKDQVLLEIEEMMDRYTNNAIPDAGTEGPDSDHRENRSIFSFLSKLFPFFKNFFS